MLLNTSLAAGATCPQLSAPLVEHIWLYPTYISFNWQNFILPFFNLLLSYHPNMNFYINIKSFIIYLLEFFVPSDIYFLKKKTKIIGIKRLTSQKINTRSPPTHPQRYCPCADLSCLVLAHSDSPYPTKITLENSSEIKVKFKNQHPFYYSCVRKYSAGVKSSSNKGSWETRIVKILHTRDTESLDQCG